MKIEYKAILQLIEKRFAESEDGFIKLHLLKGYFWKRGLSMKRLDNAMASAIDKLFYRLKIIPNFLTARFRLRPFYWPPLECMIDGFEKEIHQAMVELARPKTPISYDELVFFLETSGGKVYTTEERQSVHNFLIGLFYHKKITTCYKECKSIARGLGCDRLDEPDEKQLPTITPGKRKLEIYECVLKRKSMDQTEEEQQPKRQRLILFKKCPFCEEPYDDINVHRLFHPENEACLICGEMLVDKAAHIRDHHGPGVCPICDQPFEDRTVHFSDYHS